MPEPAGMLGQIAAAKRNELRVRFDGVSLDGLRDRASPTRRSLAAAMFAPGARFILEIKKASPSAGAIRAGADVGALARGYDGVADALSVLTDRLFFGGSRADLTAARQAFSGPILAKDFFLDPRQVVEARIAGADAVLVMLSLVDDAQARALIEEARRLAMDALVEVHDEAEMGRALALGAPLIGINNRDLRDLSIDLSTTVRLAPLAAGRTLVSESGISSRADIDRLATQVDGFLVGSSLMRADDPGQAARALIFGRVKLCGLNRETDLAVAAPAAFAGFVFAAESPRFISVDQAHPLVRAAKDRGIRPVGIFRDSCPQFVAGAAKPLGLTAVQLYGEADIGAVRRLLPASCEIWGAVSVGDHALARPGADRLLFDNGAGGTGRTFDWGLVDGHADLPSALIAGGIGPSNARAAQRLGAYAIDVGSGVDQTPGIKSRAKIEALFDALRPLGRRELRQCA